MKRQFMEEFTLSRYTFKILTTADTWDWMLQYIE
jgi:hypothetical protein